MNEIEDIGDNINGCFIITFVAIVVIAFSYFVIKEIHDWAHHDEWCQNEKGNWTRRNCNE